MTVSNRLSTPQARAGRADPATQLGGAHVRAHLRQLALVVTISGTVDPTNIAATAERAKRFVLTDKGFVLDMSKTEFVDGQCMSLLAAVDEQCRSAGVQWALVASPALGEQLRIDDAAGRYPAVSSLAEALQDFADEINSRRRRLLPLLAKTA